MRKPTMWFLNRPNTNQAAQAQKKARSLKLWIKTEEGIQVVKTVVLISCEVTLFLHRQ